MQFTQLTVYRDGEVIGHVNRHAADEPHENDNCQEAIDCGQCYHAIPMGFAVTLERYHYYTASEAIAAIEHVMLRRHGRRPELTVTEDTDWASGKVRQA